MKKKELVDIINGTRIGIATIAFVCFLVNFMLIGTGGSGKIALILIGWVFLISSWVSFAYKTRITNYIWSSINKKPTEKIDKKDNIKLK